MAFATAICTCTLHPTGTTQPVASRHHGMKITGQFYFYYFPKRKGNHRTIYTAPTQCHKVHSGNCSQAAFSDLLASDARRTHIIPLRYLLPVKETERDLSQEHRTMYCVLLRSQAITAIHGLETHGGLQGYDLYYYIFFVRDGNAASTQQQREWWTRVSVVRRIVRDRPNQRGSMTRQADSLARVQDKPALSL